MVFRKVVLTISCVLLTGLINAQDLYQPRSVKQAYENGTRSQDGRPGEITGKTKLIMISILKSIRRAES